MRGIVQLADLYLVPIVANHTAVQKFKKKKNGIYKKENMETGTPVLI